MLSSLALEISSNNNRQQHLQKLYAKLKNGYYILLPKSSSLNLNAEQNYNTKFNGNYRLEYCKFDSTRKLLVKSSRESILSVYLMMYKYAFSFISNLIHQKLVCFFFVNNQKLSHS